MMRKKILVPTNFSRQGEQALVHAQRLARSLQAEIIVLHVRDEFPISLLREREALSREVLTVQADAIELSLQSIVDSLRQDGCSARALQVVGSTHAQILRVAAYEKVDLIVMGTSGAANEGHPLGSLAERVARTAWLPVTLVRSPSFDADTRKLGIIHAARA